MLEIAIVGGGVSGLALADALHQAGKSFALYEARSRLGGRVLTKTSALTGGAIDLGPTLFWPETQPHMRALVEKLGLAHFPQHDSCSILQLSDPNQPPESLDVVGVHGGAHRLKGGMNALVTALANRLPADSLHLEHALTSIENHGDFVRLQFKTANGLTTVSARKVVLAMPPRLIAEHVSFNPVLSAELVEAMRATHTWMAFQAKAVTAFDQAFWRAAGHSGNAFSNHPQSVLAEIFDACDESGEQAALGGFVALAAESREAYRRSMPVLVESQLTLIFGKQAQDGELHYQDWSAETYTCASLDVAPLTALPVYGDQHLRQSWWGGKLMLSGAETASHAGGYLEGALESAARLKRVLISSSTSLFNSDNDTSLQRLKHWVDEQRQQAEAHYRNNLNHMLSNQYKSQVTQRALLGTVEHIYEEALRQIEQLPFNIQDVTIEQGRLALTPAVLNAFAGFNKEIVEAAIEFNRGSCAISNFPQEQVIDEEYLNVIQRDLSAAWRDFALSVNDVLLAK
ncbi:MAG TPA: amine oxidase [Methylophilaceae bacterium]|nr:amine oxidase [Methylophilaceae bacterium]